MFGVVKKLLRDRSGSDAHGVFGAVETASRNGISGWVANSGRHGQPIMIRIRAGERLVFEGAASQPRPDIDRIYGLSGAMGFSVSGDQQSGEDDGAGGLALFARSSTEGEWCQALLPREVFRDKPQVRSSDSLDIALRPLRLVQAGRPVLDGLSVLDIGCGARGLYRKAADLGARRVVAIDVRHRADAANADAAEIIRGGLFDIPNESFDVIYLTALDLAPEPKRYLRTLRDHLTPNGALILETEIGRSAGVHANTWTTVRVGDDLCRYPSSQLLKDDLLEGYVVRGLGANDEKANDAIAKQVFLCRPFRTVVVLIAARGGAGKSVIAQMLNAKGFRTFSLDRFLRRVIQSDDYNWSDLATKLRAFRNAPTLRRLDQVGRIIAGENLAEDFATAVLQDLSLETPLLFIEGEILIHEQVRSALENALRRRGTMVWSMTPSVANGPQK
jgi:SAM-dependent methyltransferase